MEELKLLVEKIVEYTRTLSIGETEWYWNINCVRKSNNPQNKEITWEEFEVAIREEILYDIVFNDLCGITNQMENDLCCWEEGSQEYNDIIKMYEEIRKLFPKFEINFC